MGVSAAPRRRKTPRSVHLSDKLANSVIRLGGVAVIAAVLGICLYLAAVVVPLFLPGTVKSGGTAVAPVESAPVAVLSDEYGGTAAIVLRDGTVESVVLESGDSLGRVAPESAVSAVSATPQGQIGWGFEDGSFQLGSIRSTAATLSPEQVRNVGEKRVIDRDGPFNGYRSLAESGTQRVTTFSLELREAVTPRTDPGRVTMLDYRVVGGGREMLFTAWADGTARLSTVRVVRPLDGSAPTLRLSGRSVELESVEDVWSVAFSDGDTLLTIGRDGSGTRYGLPIGAGRSDSLVAMERVELAGGRAVTSAAGLPGGRSVVVGSEDGSIWVWTLSRDPTSGAGDRKRMAKVERIDAGRDPIVSVTSGQRDRTITAANSIGEVRQFHVTSGKLIANLEASEVTAPSVVGMSPRQDMILVADAQGRYARWRIDPGHPGAGWRALFGRVVYEGETRPQWVYQSSSAEDAAEIKLSLVPLIYGTFKATIVAMLIAAPLSILAAIYSSEFLHRRVRTTVKPVIELMASLPSVVLGFIAMAVVAPWVGDHLAGVMLGLIIVPAVVLLAAHLWQLLPTRVLLGVPTWARLVMVGVVMLAAGAASLSVSAPAERALFGPTRSDLLLAAGSYEPAPAEAVPAWVGNRGTMSPDLERRLRTMGLAFRDGAVVQAVEAEEGSAEAAKVEEARRRAAEEESTLRQWLDGLYGKPWPGWMLLLVPVCGPLAWWLAAAVRRMIETESRSRLAIGMIELALFMGSVASAFAFAFAGARLLESVGLDPRDSFLGTFSQRNTLVVGLVMGFAIIPIIYTISEDALSAVPDTLRSASLGAGATSWQTAWRVVLPVATSGVFSACMIGLGRAAGETMIMLMATGNTPQMDLNLFSGFRTLAANIATELPEAERGGTHYRVLFLCGLVLFAVTFVINTLAEVVRQRFRKKSASL